jgi:glycosyltransferase involved in cell wall biosynthesis
MEILQVCSDSYGKSGGVSVHVRSISERLARKHNVTVYAPNFESKHPWFEMDNGVRVERFRCYAPNTAYFFSWEMLLRLQKASFDVVHGHGYHAFPLHFSTLAKCRSFIATPHFHGAGHSPFRDCLIRLLKPFGDRTLRRAEKIIAVSDYEKWLICRQFRINRDKVVVIPNGVDYSEFSGLKRRKRAFKSILYVGYLIGFKGVQHLVEVLPHLEENVVLEIVGEGPLKPYLERRVHELKVGDRVRFSANLPRKELVQKYADADVFAMLSSFEAYSIVVAEALTAGTPCVVTKASALSEWVDNRTCFGVDLPISIDSLKQKINFVLENGVERQELRKWIGTKILDWNDVAKQLESVYETGVS